MKTKEAVKHFGTAKNLADAIGVWPNVIYQWGEYPPMARQYEIEVKTGGKLKAKQNKQE